MSSTPPKKRQESKFIFEELEERRLFSGGIEGLIDTALDSSAIYADIEGSSQQADTGDSAAEQRSHEIAFVDASVDNYEQIVDDLRANGDDSRHIEVVVLDSDKDGIEEISEFLSGRDDLNAVHIISHGDDGSLQLGNSTLNATTLQDNNLKVALWANSFAETGDILIYGCNLAETEAGQGLISEISSLTLTDVAASTDLTGHASLGGDWALEFNVGQVESRVAVSAEMQQEYQGTFATYTVSTLADAGAGSLRDAITQVNSGSGGDTIEFGVAGTINLVSALPDITRQVTIDGSTAPGYTDAPVVELHGPGSGDGIWLNTGSDGSTIRGLVINNFSQSGIDIDSSGNTIVGNYIGTNLAGDDTTGTGNAEGIFVSGSDNIIGGTAPGDANIIAGNAEEGIDMRAGSGNIVQGNYIGTNPAGDNLGNADTGILIWSGANNNLVGGTQAGAGNTIAFQGGDGIAMLNGVTGNTILGNSIHSSTEQGIDLGFNGVTNNDNNDSDGGENNLQNFPVISEAGLSGSNLILSGTLDTDGNNAQYHIEFFGNPSGTQDPGNGEARYFLGATTITTNGSGDGSFNNIVLGGVTLNVGDYVTATATRIDTPAQVGSNDLLAYGDTSEFGQNFAIGAGNTAPTFGVGDGAVTTSISAGDDLASSVTIQDDGKILVAGFSVTGGVDSDFLLTRYNADGTFDTGFGSGGQIVQDLGGTFDRGYSVTVQDDGKILVGGSSFTGSSVEMALVRYNANGSLDTGFGTGGMVFTDASPGTDAIWDIFVQDDGSIVAAGSGNDQFAVVRYLANGALDPSFGGGDGIVNTDFGAGNDYAYNVEVLGDGSILVGGNSNNDFAIAKYDASGNLDTGFGGGDGMATVDVLGGAETGYGMALQSDGSIIVGGSSNNGDSDFALVRFTAAGVHDTTFNSGAGHAVTPIGSFSDIGHSVKVLPDDTILLSGYYSNGSQNEFAVVKYDANGGIDNSFGSGGISSLLIGSEGSQVFDIAVDDDGSIVLAGTDASGGNSDLALARFNADGTLSSSFDDDGSGILSGNPTFVEGGSPVVFDSDVTIYDAELSTADNFDGASLTLVRNGGANSEDAFSATGTLAILTEGGNLDVGGTIIGTVTTNSSGTLVLTFNGNATNALVNQTMRQIAYENTSGSPPASVQIDWTFDDGNSGAQGSGGALQAIGSTTVNITTVNGAPTDLSSGIELNNDGGNDAYLVNSDAGAILGGLTSFTMDFQFSIDQVTEFNPLISYATAAQQNAFLLMLVDDGTLSVLLNGAVEPALNLSGMDYRDLMDGELHSLSFSWDSTSGDWSLYVDGASLESGTGFRTGQSLAGDGGPPSPDGSIIFGQEQDSLEGGFQVGQQFVGTFYDVRIWDEVRSASEITLGHGQKLDSGNLPTGLIANWQMDGFNGS
ncbi:MAG: DUF4347 domain-containing protein, partial [Gammaproteobacteria bacterium]|nr:DUF4347 domain-containing protein [Gammaproteobacteria bacterium]